MSETNNRSQLYEPAGFFLLRAPVLPIGVFQQLTSGGGVNLAILEDDAALDTWLAQVNQASCNTIQTLVAHPLVVQALTVASRDIFEGLTYIRRDETSRRAKRAYSGLFRYLTRMSTRPTPFGLFSGIAMGQFGPHTTLQLNSDTVQSTRTRPDMGWLLSLLEQIETESALMSHMNIVINQTAYITGGRAIIPYADIYGKGDTRSITLRATPVVQYVFERARQPLPYQTLFHDIATAFPQATDQAIEGLLQQLWKHHFLMSDLRPPLTSAQPEHYVLDRLLKIAVPALDTVIKDMEAIVDDMKKIDQMRGVGATAYIHALVERQQSMITEPASDYQPYQMDTTLNLLGNHLKQEIGEAVADAVEALMRMTHAPKGAPHLREYYFAFVERYGQEAEVPLLDLLSPEAGLDAPPGYTEPRRTYPLRSVPPPETQQRDAFLCSLLNVALCQQETEIELTDARLQQLTLWEPTPFNPPLPAIEMFLQIHAASVKAMNRGEWRGIVSPACIAHGGRTFCRFFDILGEEGLKHLQEYARREEALFPNAVFAELSYLPIRGRAANVMIRPALRLHEVVVNTTPSVAPNQVIPFNDLVVGVKDEHFYLRSLRLRKEVVVTQGNMLNIMRAPNICRFLLEASEDGYPMLSPFRWGVAEPSPFLPRVVRKKIVLSPAQWNVYPSSIQSIGQGSQEARFFAGVQQWRKKWNIPRYVYLTQFDHRLLLDLEHPFSVVELQKEIKKSGGQQSVRLQEMLPDADHLWLRDSEQRPYLNEMVVPVLLKENAPVMQQKRAIENAKAHNDDQKSYPHYPISRRQRQQLPGDGWTYLKVYAPFKQHNEIITGSLRPIVQALQKQQLIDQWFFIRFTDSEPHLRVRFHACSESANSAVLNRVLDWGRGLVQSGLARDIALATYEREIERYGGPEAIELLEKLFSANSDAIMQMVAAIHTGQLTLSPSHITIFSLDRLFEAWGKDFSARLTFLQNRTDKNEARNAFRKQRRLLCELLQPWGDSSVHPSLPAQRQQLDELCALQRPAVQEVAEQIRRITLQGKLWVSEPQLLSSLAHMHINRLLGPQRDEERKVYTFWHHTLESIQKRPPSKEEGSRESNTNEVKTTK